MNNSLGQNHGSVPCVGDITPEDAWDMLKNDRNSVLVDVRSDAEWIFVGYPNLLSIGKEAVMLSWRIFPDMQINENFVTHLSNQVDNKDIPLLFLCKSGGRSLDAAIAATRAGYKKCFNIVGGFEGNIDENNQRASINGWKAAKLPWCHN